MNDYSMKLRRFLRRILVFYIPNPGWNMTALITIGGFVLMGASFLFHQFGAREVDPTIIEIGKAAFYTGMGRATMPNKVDKP